jgi:2-polyprenyl-3-methyl-5-hydroxy-6-metoxy-1,4-benzoquinol methylase
MEILTNKPIAIDSNDHIKPHGALNTAHNGEEFFIKLKEEFPGLHKVLDIGTGPGVFVTNGLSHGYDIYGIDGTDAVERFNDWVELKDHRLFHTDLQVPFTLVENGALVTFDLITAWDVMEHMTEEKINIVLCNIRSHLKIGGYLMATIEYSNLNNELYHHICYDRPWWEDKFDEFGFENLGFKEVVQKTRGNPEHQCFCLRRVV